MCEYACVCVQTFMQDIILCAPSRASQHQARATYSYKQHVASHKTWRFSSYPSTSLYTHIMPL